MFGVTQHTLDKSSAETLPLIEHCMQSCCASSTLARISYVKHIQANAAAICLQTSICSKLLSAAVNMLAALAWIGYL